MEKKIVQMKTPLRRELETKKNAFFAYGQLF